MVGGKTKTSAVEPGRIEPRWSAGVFFLQYTKVYKTLRNFMTPLWDVG